MQLVLPESVLSVKLTLDPATPMSDDEYFELCASNPDIRFERTANGEIVIVPPAGMESDYRNANILTQLGNWALRDKRGKFFGPSVEYILPSGAAYSPDASWVSNERLATLTKQQKQKFPRVVPEFIIEVMSPSDRLKAAKDKMADWMADGVSLGWLVDEITRPFTSIVLVNQNRRNAPAFRNSTAKDPCKV